MALWYVIDRRAWPQVWIHFNGTPENPDQFRRFLQDMSLLYADRVQFSMLFDTRKLGLPGTEYISAMAQWIHTHRADAQAHLRCSAVVITNPAVRIFIMAVLKLRPPSAPYKLCASMREAATYLRWLKP